MWILIDPAVESFLEDHRVGGHPLLPTAMGLDLLAGATLGQVGDGGRVTVISDVRVGPPVLFDTGLRLPELAVEVGPATADESNADRDGSARHHCVLASPPVNGTPVWHFAARVTVEATPDDQPAQPVHILGTDGPVGPVGAESLPLNGSEVYPPYFHGPTFQVVSAAGATPEGVVARLAIARPPLTWSWRATVTAPALLELCLQTAGLWELATTGRMMIPHGIDEVRLAAVPGHDGAATAHVRPRRTGADDATVFDATVVDDRGSVLLTVSGYRTVDLGHVVDPDVSARFAELLRPAAVGAR